MYIELLSWDQLDRLELCLLSLLEWLHWSGINTHLIVGGMKLSVSQHSLSGRHIHGLFSRITIKMFMFVLSVQCQKSEAGKWDNISRCAARFVWSKSRRSVYDSDPRPCRDGRDGANDRCVSRVSLLISGSTWIVLYDVADDWQLVDVDDKSPTCRVKWTWAVWHSLYPNERKLNRRPGRYRLATKSLD